jgi:hypothetical protein
MTEYEIEIDFKEAKSAAFALKIGWENCMSASDNARKCQSAMRKAAMEIILKTRYADDSVYDSLEKSYITNVISEEPDYEEINKTIDALAAINTEKSAGLLFVFLQGLHQKKHSGMWGEKEETIFPWIVNSFCFTNINSKNLWNLLVVIFRTEIYSNDERLHVKNTLAKIKSAVNQTSLKAS